MRLTQERVKHIASSIVTRLKDHGCLESVGSEDVFVQAVERAITNELAVEDRLNAEVRELLKQFQDEFDKGRADYQTMFTKVKAKLVQERGLVL